MKKEIFNYQFNKKYSLQKINIYAYSFFATNLLERTNFSTEFSVDLNSIISHISDSIEDHNDSTLDELRHENHEKYYQINVKFLTGIDKRYRKIADKILKNYARINSKNLLQDDMETAKSNQELIQTINISVDKLREKMKNDLLLVMDYIDQEERKMDLSFIRDDNEIANRLKKRYDALLLHKSVINMDNLNLELKRQRDRLGIIKQLNPLIEDYHNNREKLLQKDYQIDDVMILRNNLSTIIGEYIFLLSHQEFHDVRKMYQGLLANDYSFVNDFLYTYRIIMDKIWKYCLTDYKQYKFDFNYMICLTDRLNKESKVFLMNRSNMYQYNQIGYICTIEGNIFDTLLLTKKELLNLRFPHDIKDKIAFSVNEPNNIKIEVIYNQGRKHIYNDKYEIMELK